MHFKEIQRNHLDISKLILNNEISNAINLLFGFAKNSKKQYHHNKIEKVKETYSNILKHTFKAAHDPERDSIYVYVQRSLLEINDQVKECLLTETSELTIYKMKWSVEKKLENQTDEAFSLVSSLTFDRELEQILKDNNIKVNSSKSENSTHLTRQDTLKELFHYLWLSDNYKEAEMKILETICFSEKIPWHDKSIVVSAITLSLLRVFDKNKFLILIKFYRAKEFQIWQRALIGLLLGLYKYDTRLQLYPDLVKELNKLSKLEEIDKEIEAAIIQIFKSKDTEKITKRWENEILPEMMKMQPKIEKSLDLENILSDKFIEDKNPDWEKVFEDSPDLFDKLQDFSKMQIEGSDVFMSAFSKLKHFPFFNEVSNWFTPFYKENDYIEMIFEKEESNLRAFVEQLETSFHMCNSDKYSFCLNLQMIPQSHKSMMMEMFNEEMKSMEEVAKDENLFNDFAASKNIFTQYVQDLYRFYKLHPYKNEFSDIFKWDFDIQNWTFLNRIVTNIQVTRNIAEFFLENHHFDQAAELFKVIEKSQGSNIELFEKIGYCYQQIGKYEEALTYYKKAEIIDTKKAWITKKIALCYRYLNRHEEALEYYKEAEKLEPDNLYIQAYVGHTLLRLKLYEEALKYYFKVEYLSSSNEKIQRPIAWISFMIGKFDTAITYYTKILGKKISEFDLIHLGHVYWCINDIDKAIESYKTGYEYLNYNMEKFNQVFDDDIEHLLKFGINKLDISLMKDFILESNKN